MSSTTSSRPDPGHWPHLGRTAHGSRLQQGFPELRAAFNSFLTQIKQDGTYMKLVKKYFRAAPRYLPEFFKDLPSGKK